MDIDPFVSSQVSQVCSGMSSLTVAVFIKHFCQWAHDGSAEDANGSDNSHHWDVLYIVIGCILVRKRTEGLSLYLLSDKSFNSLLMIYQTCSWKEIKAGPLLRTLGIFPVGWLSIYLETDAPCHGDECQNRVFSGFNLQLIFKSSKFLEGCEF